MIERVAQRHDLKPQRLIGDTAYGTGPMLEWLVEGKGIEPHVPVWEKTRRDNGTFSVSDFQWDEQANEYRCPQGEPLRCQWRAFSNPRGINVTSADTIVYRSAQSACTACPLKSRNDRKKVEVLLAHLNRILKLDRLRLRGRRGAREEFLLAATAQNLRRMAKRWMQMTMIEPIRAT